MSDASFGALETVDESGSDIPNSNDGAEAAVETSSEEVAQDIGESAVAEATAPDETDGEDVEVSSDASASAEVEEPKKESRSQSRIRELAAEKNQLAAQVEQVRRESLQQIQMLQHQMQVQAQERAEAMQEQVRLQREQFDWQRSRAQAEEDANLPEHVKLRNQLKQEFKSEALKEVEQLYAERFAKIDAIEQREQQRQTQAQQRQRINALEQAVTSHVKQSVLHDLDSGDQAALGEKAADLLATFSVTFNRTPDVAAKEFRDLLDQYHRAKNKAIAAKAKGKPVNGATPAAAAPKKQTPKPGAAQPFDDLFFVG
jgi:hypothetical protein